MSAIRRTASREGTQGHYDRELPRPAGGRGAPWYSPQRNTLLGRIPLLGGNQRTEDNPDPAPDRASMGWS